MKTMILVVPPAVSGVNMDIGYIIGSVIALFILGYLIYALIKPDKF